jgi:hypothetical protein
MEESKSVRFAWPIITYPANVPCPVCGAVVQDWHTEWTDPAQGSDFYKGLRAIVRSAGDGSCTRNRRFKPSQQGPSPKEREGFRSRRHAGPNRSPGQAICAIIWIKQLPDNSTGITLPTKRYTTPTLMPRLTRGINHVAD